MKKRGAQLFQSLIGFKINWNWVYPVPLGLHGSLCLLVYRYQPLSDAYINQLIKANERAVNRRSSVSPIGDLRNLSHSFYYYSTGF